MSSGGKAISGGTWSQATVAEHTCDVFEPNVPHPLGLVIVYLHGIHLDPLIDKPVFSAEFARHGLRVICPHAGPTWWSDKLYPPFDAEVSPERYVLQRVLPYVAESWPEAPTGLGILGTSMGGQGALRLSFKHPRQFPAVAAISPAIDHQIRWQEGDPALRAMYSDAEAVRQDTATLHVHPLNWPRHTWLCCDPSDLRWHESADRLRMKLAALGIPFESDLETSAGGHGFDYYNHMAPAAVGFLVTRLEQEARRVP